MDDLISLVDRYLGGVPLSRAGFEIELLAPAGSSRKELAAAMAAGLTGASVHAGFHLDAEPSGVPGMGVFHHLTPAFEVHTKSGELLCSLVDDVTIITDLDPGRAALPGWYRIVSDDRRLLRLVARHCTPDSPIESCLTPVADLFGVTAVQLGEFSRVNDPHGATIAIAAPLNGDRHRVCEIITPPLSANHLDRLEELLTHARALGFGIPAEAAVHVHFDAEPFRDSHAMRNLIRLVLPRLELLRLIVATNPRCRRLGSLPAELMKVVESEDFVTATWAVAQTVLESVGLHKYMDVNLCNILRPPPDKDTIEWRILPGAIDAPTVIAGARLFQALLNRAVGPSPVPRVEAPIPATWQEAETFLGSLAEKIEMSSN